MSDRIAVIGNPESVFVQEPVRYWRRLGADACIVTPSWPSATVADGLPVVSAETIAPASVTRYAAAMTPLFAQLDGMVMRHEPDRVRAALHSWGPSAVLPSLAPPIRSAIVIAAALEVVRPVAVLGHEAFAYGLATQLAPETRRSLFVWGADVLHYAHTSDAAMTMVGQALRAMRFVLVGSESMQAEVHARFAVPLDRIAVVTYGVDSRQFHRATADEQHGLRSRYGIPPGAPILMNLRRFLPHWGASLASDVLLAALAARPDLHVIAIEGAQHSPHFEAFVDRASAMGARHRVTAVHGQMALDDIAALMTIADVGLSLVDSFEPLSLSVLQAAACGSELVVADQLTYRQACAAGLAATLVPPSTAAVTDAALAAIARSGAETTASVRNQRFIAMHHDHDAAMRRQLRIVAGEAVANRLLAA